MKKSKIAILILIAAAMLCSCESSTYDTNNNEETSASVSEIILETSGDETTLTKSDTIVNTDSDDVNNIIPSELDVYINAKALMTSGKARFYIETNLPDETVLMLSLRRGNYNTDDHFTAQTKVTISNGKALSDAFSNKGKSLSGEYDLTISMSIPTLQSDAVREIIGQNGEYMIGSIVEDSNIGNNKVVSALFTFSADDGTITSTTEYNNTIFRDDDTDNHTESIITTMDYNKADLEKEKVEKKVKEYIDENYTYTELDSITLNENLGTDDDEDYIAMVYLTWNQKNSGNTSKKMLDLYSSDMAARMYDDMPEIQELAVFWTVPYLNNGSAKISFERSNSGMKYTDTNFDSNFD